MFEAFFGRFLSTFLSKYFTTSSSPPDDSPSSLKKSTSTSTSKRTDEITVSVWSGFILLENLIAKTSLLNNLLKTYIFPSSHLPPFQFHSLTIGRLEIVIPWSSLGSKPVVVVVDRVYCVFRADCHDVNTTDTTSNTTSKNKEITRRREILSTSHSTPQSSSASASASSSKTPSFFSNITSSLITTILSTLHLHIRDLHIRFEDTTSSPIHQRQSQSQSQSQSQTSPYAIGITLESLHFSSDGNDCDGLEREVVKHVQVNYLAVYWNNLDFTDTDANLNTKSQSHKLTSSTPLTLLTNTYMQAIQIQIQNQLYDQIPRRNNLDPQNSNNTQDNNGNTNTSTNTNANNKPPEHCYVLKPVNVRCEVVVRRPSNSSSGSGIGSSGSGSSSSGDSNTSTKPSLSIKIKISPVYLELRSLQLHQLSSLFHSVRRNERYSVYTKLRPTCCVKGNAKKWWVFAGDVVRGEVREHRLHRNGNGSGTIDLSNIVERGKWRVVYMDLFRRQFVCDYPKLYNIKTGIKADSDGDDSDDDSDFVYTHTPLTAVESKLMHGIEDGVVGGLSVDDVVVFRAMVHQTLNRLYNNSIRNNNSSNNNSDDEKEIEEAEEEDEKSFLHNLATKFISFSEKLTTDSSSSSKQAVVDAREENQRLLDYLELQFRRNDDGKNKKKGRSRSIIDSNPNDNDSSDSNEDEDSSRIAVSLSIDLTWGTITLLSSSQHLAHPTSPTRIRIRSLPFVEFYMKALSVHVCLFDKFDLSAFSVVVGLGEFEVNELKRSGACVPLVKRKRKALSQVCDDHDGGGEGEGEGVEIISPSTNTNTNELLLFNITFEHKPQTQTRFKYDNALIVRLKELDVFVSPDVDLVSEMLKFIPKHDDEDDVFGNVSGRCHAPHDNNNNNTSTNNNGGDGNGNGNGNSTSKWAFAFVELINSSNINSKALKNQLESRLKNAIDNYSKLYVDINLIAPVISITNGGNGNGSGGNVIMRIDLGKISLCNIARVDDKYGDRDRDSLRRSRTLSESASSNGSYMPSPLMRSMSGSQSQGQGVFNPPRISSSKGNTNGRNSPFFNQHDDRDRDSERFLTSSTTLLAQHHSDIRVLTASQIFQNQRVQGASSSASASVSTSIFRDRDSPFTVIDDNGVERSRDMVTPTPTPELTSSSSAIMTESSSQHAPAMTMIKSTSTSPYIGIGSKKHPRVQSLVIDSGEAASEFEAPPSKKSVYNNSSSSAKRGKEFTELYRTNFYDKFILEMADICVVLVSDESKASSRKAKAKSTSNLIKKMSIKLEIHKSFLPTDHTLSKLRVECKIDSLRCYLTEVNVTLISLLFLGFNDANGAGKSGRDGSRDGRDDVLLSKGLAVPVILRSSNSNSNANSASASGKGRQFAKINVSRDVQAMYERKKLSDGDAFNGGNASSNQQPSSSSPHLQSTEKKNTSNDDDDDDDNDDGMDFLDLDFYDADEELGDSYSFANNFTKNMRSSASTGSPLSRGDASSLNDEKNASVYLSKENLARLDLNSVDGDSVDNGDDVNDVNDGLSNTSSSSDMNMNIHNTISDSDIQKITAELKHAIHQTEETIDKIKYTPPINRLELKFEQAKLRAYTSSLFEMTVLNDAGSVTNSTSDGRVSPVSLDNVDISRDCNDDSFAEEKTLNRASGSSFADDQRRSGSKILGMSSSSSMGKEEIDELRRSAPMRARALLRGPRAGVGVGVGVGVGAAKSNGNRKIIRELFEINVYFGAFNVEISAVNNQPLLALAVKNMELASVNRSDKLTVVYSIESLTLVDEFSKSFNQNHSNPNIISGTILSQAKLTSEVPQLLGSNFFDDRESSRPPSQFTSDHIKTEAERCKKGKFFVVVFDQHKRRRDADGGVQEGKVAVKVGVEALEFSLDRGSAPALIEYVRSVQSKFKSSVADNNTSATVATSLDKNVKNGCDPFQKLHDKIVSSTSKKNESKLKGGSGSPFSSFGFCVTVKHVNARLVNNSSSVAAIAVSNFDCMLGKHIWPQRKQGLVASVENFQLLDLSIRKEYEIMGYRQARELQLQERPKKLKSMEQFLFKIDVISKLQTGDDLNANPRNSHWECAVNVEIRAPTLVLHLPDLERIVNQVGDLKESLKGTQPTLSSDDIKSTSQQQQIPTSSFHSLPSSSSKLRKSVTSTIPLKWRLDSSVVYPKIVIPLNQQSTSESGLDCFVGGCSSLFLFAYRTSLDAGEAKNNRYVALESGLFGIHFARLCDGNDEDPIIARETTDMRGLVLIKESRAVQTQPLLVFDPSLSNRSVYSTFKAAQARSRLELPVISKEAKSAKIRHLKQMDQIICASSSPFNIGLSPETLAALKSVKDFNKTLNKKVAVIEDPDEKKKSRFVVFDCKQISLDLLPEFYSISSEKSLVRFDIDGLNLLLVQKSLEYNSNSSASTSVMLSVARIRAFDLSVPEHPICILHPYENSANTSSNLSQLQIKLHIVSAADGGKKTCGIDIAFDGTHFVVLPSFFSAILNFSSASKDSLDGFPDYSSHQDMQPIYEGSMEDGDSDMKDSHEDLFDDTINSEEDGISDLEIEGPAITLVPAKKKKSDQLIRPLLLFGLDEVSTNFNFGCFQIHFPCEGLFYSNDGGSGGGGVLPSVSVISLSWKPKFSLAVNIEQPDRHLSTAPKMPSEVRRFVRETLNGDRLATPVAAGGPASGSASSVDIGDLDLDSDAEKNRVGRTSRTAIDAEMGARFLFRKLSSSAGAESPDKSALHLRPLHSLIVSRLSCDSDNIEVFQSSLSTTKLDSYSLGGNAVTVCPSSPVRAREKEREKGKEKANEWETKKHQHVNIRQHVVFPFDVRFKHVAVLTSFDGSQSLAHSLNFNVNRIDARTFLDFSSGNVGSTTGGGGFVDVGVMETTIQPLTFVFKRGDSAENRSSNRQQGGNNEYDAISTSASMVSTAIEGRGPSVSTTSHLTHNNNNNNNHVANNYGMITPTRRNAASPSKNDNNLTTSLPNLSIDDDARTYLSYTPSSANMSRSYVLQTPRHNNNNNNNSVRMIGADTDTTKKESPFKALLQNSIFHADFKSEGLRVFFNTGSIRSHGEFPFMKVKVDKVETRVSFRKHVAAGYLDCSRLTIDYQHRGLVAWEPFIEPWAFRINISLDLARISALQGAEDVPLYLPKRGGSSARKTRTFTPAEAGINVKSSSRVGMRESLRRVKAVLSPRSPLMRSSSPSVIPPAETLTNLEPVTSNEYTLATSTTLDFSYIILHMFALNCASGAPMSASQITSLLGLEKGQSGAIDSRHFLKCVGFELPEITSQPLVISLVDTPPVKEGAVATKRGLDVNVTSALMDQLMSLRRAPIPYSFKNSKLSIKNSAVPLHWIRNSSGLALQYAEENTTEPSMIPRIACDTEVPLTLNRHNREGITSAKEPHRAYISIKFFLDDDGSSSNISEYKALRFVPCDRVGVYTYSLVKNNATIDSELSSATTNEVPRIVIVSVKLVHGTKVVSVESPLRIVNYTENNMDFKVVFKQVVMQGISKNANLPAPYFLKPISGVLKSDRTPYFIPIHQVNEARNAAFSLGGIEIDILKKDGFSHGAIFDSAEFRIQKNVMNICASALVLDESESGLGAGDSGNRRRTSRSSSNLSVMDYDESKPKLRAVSRLISLQPPLAFVNFLPNPIEMEVRTKKTQVQGAGNKLENEARESDNSGSKIATSTAAATATAASDTTTTAAAWERVGVVNCGLSRPFSKIEGSTDIELRVRVCLDETGETASNFPFWSTSVVFPGIPITDVMSSKRIKPWTGSVQLRDVNGSPLTLRLKIEAGNSDHTATRIVSVFVPFWVIDTTGMKLEYLSRRNKKDVEGGSSISPSSSFEGEQEDPEKVKYEAIGENKNGIKTVLAGQRRRYDGRDDSASNNFGLKALLDESSLNTSTKSSRYFDVHMLGDDAAAELSIRALESDTLIKRASSSASASESAVNLGVLSPKSTSSGLASTKSQKLPPGAWSKPVTLTISSSIEDVDVQTPTDSPAIRWFQGSSGSGVKRQPLALSTMVVSAPKSLGGNLGTKLIHITCRYTLINNLGRDFLVTPCGLDGNIAPGADETLLPCDGTPTVLHFDDNCSVKMRPKELSWDYSGSFKLKRSVNDGYAREVSFRMRNPRKGSAHESSEIIVNVTFGFANQLRFGTEITFRVAESPPFFITNESTRNLTIFQAPVVSTGRAGTLSNDAKSEGVLLLSHHKPMPFAWTNPDAKKRILVIAKEDDKTKNFTIVGKFELDMLAPTSELKADDGFFHAEIITDGPTRVLRITASCLKSSLYDMYAYTPSFFSAASAAADAPVGEKAGREDEGLDGRKRIAAIGSGNTNPNNSQFGYELFCKLENGFSISVVNGEPQELIFLKLSGVEVSKEVDASGIEVGHLSIRDIQVDNQLWITDYPVLLKSRKNKRLVGGSSSGIAKVNADAEEKALTVDYTRDLSNRSRTRESVILLKDFKVNIRPLDIQVDGNLIVRVVDIVRLLNAEGGRGGESSVSENAAFKSRDSELVKCLGVQRQAPKRSTLASSRRESSSSAIMSSNDKNEFNSPHIFLTSTTACSPQRRKPKTFVNESDDDVREEEREERRRKINVNTKKASRKIYFENLHISSIDLRLSFVLPPSLLTDTNLSLSKTAKTAISILSVANITNIDVAPIFLRGYSKSYTFGTAEDHLHQLVGNYRGAALQQAYWILGSIEFLGNPTRLFLSIKDGYEVLSQELKSGYGRSNSLIGAFSGGAIGSVSLIRHVAHSWLYGVSRSIAHSADHVAGMCGSWAITMFPEGGEGLGLGMSMGRNRALDYHGIPRDASEGVVQAIAGMPAEIIANCQLISKRYILFGFLKGLLRGSLGGVMKVAIGNLKSASFLTGALADIIGQGVVTSNRTRAPRFFYSGVFDGQRTGGGNGGNGGKKLSLKGTLLVPYVEGDNVGYDLLSRVEIGRYICEGYRLHFEKCSSAAGGDLVNKKSRNSMSVLLTNTRCMLLSVLSSHERFCELEWEVQFRNIVNIELEFSKEKEGGVEVDCAVVNIWHLGSSEGGRREERRGRGGGGFSWATGYFGDSGVDSEDSSGSSGGGSRYVIKNGLGLALSRKTVVFKGSEGRKAGEQLVVELKKMKTLVSNSVFGDNVRKLVKDVISFGNAPS